MVENMRLELFFKKSILNTIWNWSGEIDSIRGTKAKLRLQDKKGKGKGKVNVSQYI